jgi:hypothetical protein
MVAGTQPTPSFQRSTDVGCLSSLLAWAVLVASITYGVYGTLEALRSSRHAIVVRHSQRLKKWRVTFDESSLSLLSALVSSLCLVEDVSALHYG